MASYVFSATYMTHNVLRNPLIAALLYSDRRRRPLYSNQWTTRRRANINCCIQAIDAVRSAVLS
jgi:hypothetical protein